MSISSLNNISSGISINKSKELEVVKNYIQKMNIKTPSENQIIKNLSGGNQQKVAIGKALMTNPKLLILDEPLFGLDTRSAVIMKEIFRLHTQQGGSILFSTHIMDLAQHLCTRIGIINNGSIIAEGSFEELQNQSHSTKSLEQLFLELTDQSESTSNILQELQQLPALKAR